MAIGQSAELLFRISGDSSGGETAIKRTAAELKQLDAVAKSIGSTMQSVGASITSVGTSLTVAITAPLAALATFGVRAALEFDQIRNKITALVGDAGAAGDKIAELTALAERSVGVTRNAALESFATLRGIGGISDDTINKVIASLGKLNAAFNIDDLAGFQRNLNQIFAQGFERADIKEAIGRVPFFEQLLEQAFGTSDGEKLKKLKESGKLTLDAFLAGISEAIDNDDRVANITESLGTQLAKSTEKLQTALVPLGQAILDLVVPALNAIVPYIQQASEYFAQLSAPVQTVVIAVAALAAAAGPLLIIVGGLVAAVGSIVAAAVPLGIALAVVVGLFLQLGPILVIVAAQWAALYDAWTRNAAGLRDITTQTFENIKATIQGALTAIQTFWTNHGARVLEIVTRVWDSVKTVVQSAVNVLAGVISVGLNLINGNWQGAWNAFLSIIQNATRAVITVANGLFTSINAILSRLLAAIVQYGPPFISAMASWATRAVITVVGIIASLPLRLISLIPQFIAAGSQIGSAIWRGIRQALSEGLAASVSAGLGAAGTTYEGVSAGLGAIGVRGGGVGAPRGAGGGGAGAGGGGAGAGRDTAKDDLTANIDRQTLKLKLLRDEYERTMSAIRAEFKQTGDSDVFLSAAREATAKFAADADAILLVLNRLEQVALKNPTPNQTQLLLDQQQERLDEIQRRKTEDIKENAALVTDSEQELADKIVEISEDTERRKTAIENRRLENFRKTQQNVLEAAIRSAVTPDEALQFQVQLNAFLIEQAERQKAFDIQRLEEERDRRKAKIAEEIKDEAAKLEQLKQLDEEFKLAALEAEEKFQQTKSEIDEKYGTVGVNPEDEGAAYGPFQGLIDGFEEFATLVESRGPALGEIFQSIGGLATQAFAGFANALGSVVENWVLLGETGPAVMRRILAQALASIAAEAAVRALWELALGFASLFFNPAEAAAHFTAAAIFGGIAGVAAIAGRAVAGDSFKKQTGAATGSSGRASSSQNRDSSNQGQAFSGKKDGSIDLDANAPGKTGVPVTLTLKISDDSQWLGKMLKFDAETNGGARQVIRAYAQD